MASGADLRYELIAAVDENEAIGIDNKLPWSIPSEFEFFTRISSTPRDPKKKCVAVMGSRSWSSLPESCRPFPNCINIILSSQMSLPDGYEDTYVCRSWVEMENLLTTEPLASRVDRIWVHGGTALYKHALESPYFYRLYKTRVKGTFPADTWFPEITIKLKKIIDPEAPQGIITDSGHSYEVEVFEKDS